ncbi:MAG: hypothetical protein H6713_04705 [Myxococcales bacterium]|nr:hypothetical protein [Myxococcales bacterium]MCB9749292.1 hypothetical protein [Myxococcales bacterium]
MLLSTRRLAPLCVLLLTAAPACDGGKKDDAKAETKTDAKADEKAADAKADEADDKKEPKTLEPGKVELPWTWERVSGSFEMGMEFTYDLSGTDAKGKELKDQFLCKIPKANDKEVGVVCNTVEKPSKDKGAGQVATLTWSEFSPMFSVEKPTHELKSRETITVPAGEFDCVVADLKDFFGKQLTVWMIVDKPGVYAKVIETMPNAEDDKTNKVYELAAIKTAE